MRSTILLLLTLSTDLRQLPPVDETSKDPALAKFRTDLLQIIAQRDAVSLRQRIAKNAMRDLGGGTIEESWRPGSHDTRFWAVAKKLLELGGTLSVGGQRATYPYVSARFPRDLNGDECTVVIQGNVPLRATPAANARVLRTLSYDILRNGAASVSGWANVVTFDGVEGFVRDSQVHSPLDCRLILQRERARWEIFGLICGD